MKTYSSAIKGKNLMKSIFKDLNKFKTPEPIVNHLQAIFIKNKGDVQVQDVTNIENFLTSTF